MITSNATRAGHPSRVLVKKSDKASPKTGLLADSVIMTDNLATLLENEIDRRIGTWPKMALVDDALRHTLGL